MERPISRRNIVRNRSKSISIKKKGSLYAVDQITKQTLTPLQRLKNFKKLQEKQAKFQSTNPKKPGSKRVTFADEMTSEVVTVNGSHETDLNIDEKILKPRKTILSNDQDESVMQNGSNENGSISENGDGKDVENGHDIEIQNGETSKQNKKSARQKNLQEKRESTPNRQLLLREAKTVKESTPKPETPTKRELRQATPRRTTPKPETPNKRELKPRGTPAKIPERNSEQNFEENGSEKKIATTIEHTVKDENINLKADESAILIEDSLKEGNSVVSISDTDEVVEKDIPQEKSFFSAFRRIGKRSSLESKDMYEASSSSIICLDSPSINEAKTVPSGEIKGRKPINSFSRFPGRNVSISSIDKSLKRKAEESFEEEDRKRFAGETASDSEKSPGWSFFSPSLRVWSPPQAAKTSLPTSTPFHKREEQDSMAVNYDSKTRLDLDESMESDTLSSKQKANKWCTIM